MKISYENTDEDAVAWNYLRITQTPAGKKAQKNVRIALTLCQALIGVIGYLLICVVLSVKSYVFGMLFSAALAGAFGYAAQSLQFRRVVRRQTRTLKKNGHFDQFLGPKEVTVSTDGMRTSWPEGETFRQWSALSGVEAAEEHLLFVYGDTEFVVIPRRAFRDAAHEQEFLATVERFRTGVVAVTAGESQHSDASRTPPWWRNRGGVDTAEKDSFLKQRQP